MASYLPSGVDYIPQIQPFNPNLNFMQAALERKEAQYKEGYNKINGIYGSLLNSPMLGSVDNETRDKFFKDIETNIQKVSGMDLSLQENTDDAYKVFQPIIDDKNIMKNIAWTKNYQNEVSKGEAERYNIDPEKGGDKYWDTGIQALHYQAEDFAKSADQHQAQNIEAPRYVPHNNTYKLALDHVKKEGFKTIAEAIGKDGFLHTYTNGDLLQGNLTNYLMGAFGSDPGAIDAANTEAYVTRKNSIKVGVPIYGSEEASEAHYLNNEVSSLNKQAKNNELAQDSVIKFLTAQGNVIDKKIKDGSNDPRLLESFVNTHNQLDNAISAKNQYSKMGSYVAHSNLLGSDKDIIRKRVDSAKAYDILGTELTKAARDYSQLTAEHKLTVNPYTEKAVDQSYKLAYLEREKVLSGEGDFNKLKWKYEFDKLSKEAPNTDPFFNVAYNPTSLPGNFTAEGTNPSLAEYEQVKGEFNDNTKRYATDYNQATYDHYKNIIDSDSFSQDEKTVAEKYIKDTYGPYLTKGTVLLKSGTLSQDKDYNTGWRDVYSRAKGTIKNDKLLTSDSFTGSLSDIEKEHDRYNHAYIVADNVDHKNNLAVKNYVNIEGPTDQFTPEVKRNFNYLINDKGVISNPDEFKKKVMRDSYLNSDEADDLYYETKKTYTDLYNRDKLSEDPRLNVTPWDGASAQGNYGGAKGAMSLNYNMSADKGTSFPTRGLMSAYNDLSLPGAYIAKGGANGFVNESSLVKDDQYNLVAKAIMDDVRKGKWDKTETIPAGKIIHQGIIAGNKDLTGVTFIPSHETVEKYIGKPKQPGVASGISEDLEKNGFTIVLPIKETSNLFTEHETKSLDDHLINFEPIKTDKGKLGTYTIKKTNRGFTVSGNINTYDQNGNPTTIPIDPGNYRYTNPLFKISDIKTDIESQLIPYQNNNTHWEEAKKKLNSRK